MIRIDQEPESVPEEESDRAQCESCNGAYEFDDGWFGRFCSPECALDEAEKVAESPRSCGTDLAIAAEVHAARAADLKKRAQRMGAKVSAFCRHSYGTEIVRGDLAFTVDGMIVARVSPGEFMQALKAAARPNAQVAEPFRSILNAFGGTR